MAHISIKRFSSPDETRPFADKGHAEILRFGEGTVGRGVFEPGWRWSTHVKPIAGTRSCQAAHSGYVVSGRMHLVMDDGEEAEMAAGDYVTIPPGHDAWTVGDEACVIIDVAGMEHYAEGRTASRAQQGTEAQPPAHH
ncbi:cupin domain-containing protein [Anaeromyxobacter sp. Fw109-5]|uniref:cupin domain-containing protein n=1 Tax=Anaeromyxobacter sp. (strain Fw109-5) TaxID=404589 RepID=UPI0000ED7E51|nr:cupin domain-containing protein [Anaeromyxobacter sp. Fw109-5]ABS25841.1 Cupin 2 conserved barrel domain protein [Anaeromyxobacter sp. Fw109-5]